MSDIPPYPLAWPDGVARTLPGSAIAGTFKTTLAGARDNVENELRRFGNDTGKRVSDVVMTSNMTALGGAPVDKGVGVWFMWDGGRRAIAVDRYASIASNLQAIAKVIEAQRAIMRHGGLNIVRANFRGFTALPAPVNWRQTLCYGPDESTNMTEVSARYREMARKTGGDEVKLLPLNLARDAAQEELKNG